MTKNTEVSRKEIKASRAWELHPNDGEHLYWSVDSRNGVVQGPLDFRFLQGRKILLQLAPRQVALLIRGGELTAVFLEGGHPLSIGYQPDQVTPESELIFLAADRPLEFVWRSDAFLWVPTGQSQPERVLIRGRCVCRVSGPARFFAAFLRHSTNVSEPFTLRVIDALIRSSIEQTVARARRFPSTPNAELAELLTQLTPGDLNPALQELGLECNELVIRSALADRELVPQTAGQLALDRVNRG